MSADPPELLARLQLCLLLQQFCLHCRAGVCSDILHPFLHERYLDRVHRLSEHCRHISEDSHTAYILNSFFHCQHTRQCFDLREDWLYLASGGARTWIHLTFAWSLWTMCHRYCYRKGQTQSKHCRQGNLHLKKVEVTLINTSLLECNVKNYWPNISEIVSGATELMKKMEYNRNNITNYLNSNILAWSNK